MARVLNKRKDKIPADAIYVGRPSKWGNPFSHIPVGTHRWQVKTRKEAAEKFRAWVMLPEQSTLRKEAKRELRGKNLVCYCAPLDCHAYVWFEIVNGYDCREAV
jgi:hypothetical protein